MVILGQLLKTIKNYYDDPFLGQQLKTIKDNSMDTK